MLRVVRTPRALPPERDLAEAHALLVRVAAGEEPPTLRLSRPAPTVAFGKLDRIRPGFAAAVAAARARGYGPALRSAGGNAAAYHEGSLAFEHVIAADDPIPGMHDRFREAAERIARALATLGVDARVGEVAGEFCPGAFSVNARGALKLAGTGQRMIRGGALLGASIVVNDGAAVRAVLTDVYEALDIDWLPATSGAVEDEAPGATVDAVEGAILAAYAEDYELTDGALGPATPALAERLEPEHRL
jgi:lipoate-protein ligase A